jgi:hypothetical protein
MSDLAMAILPLCLMLTITSRKQQESIPCLISTADR